MIDQMIPALKRIARKYKPEHVFLKYSDRSCNRAKIESPAKWDSKNHSNMSSYHIDYNHFDFHMSCERLNSFVYFPKRIFRDCFNDETFLVQIWDADFANALVDNYSFDVVFYGREEEALACAKELAAYLAENVRHLSF